MEISTGFKVVASEVASCKDALKKALRIPHPQRIKVFCRAACHHLSLVMPSLASMLSKLTIRVDISEFSDVKTLVEEMILQLSEPCNEESLEAAIQRTDELADLIWQHSHAAQGKASRELIASPETDVLHLHGLVLLALPHPRVCVCVCVGS